MRFFYKDYREGGKRKVLTLAALEFIDRFLGHVLPPRIKHIRHYGFLAPHGRAARLKKIRRILGRLLPLG